MSLTTREADIIEVEAKIKALYLDLACLKVLSPNMRGVERSRYAIENRITELTNNLNKLQE